MIVNDKDAIARLTSPMNLINQLSASAKPLTIASPRKSAMSLFGVRSLDEKMKEDAKEIKPSFNPFNLTQKIETEVEQESLKPLPAISDTSSEAQTSLDSILENHDSQIKLGLAHDKALELLNRSVEMLATKLDDIRADKLPAVVSAASKTVESIRKERNEHIKNNGKDHEVHYHFYTPNQKLVSDYKIIDVTEAADTTGV